ncbi:uncharacterized protein BDR25DRAFT_241695 [Lindgomyces ingoldianus]|uniref:Uncharacterized protein n=1 Tax=Lindgomyces ingoldianus TaxID=673940 RepID=A0ACB6QCM3_9PLEO|nr:uncharacterized protein BDR25DRAFT_241695 [Lindgomyces ingoldianus]KAF2464679.1 hypothetical protein BDR25DRAFT_241695 [Lindgomyces ingoldianus]
MADAIKHFNKVPWAAAMINDSTWTPRNTASRIPKPTFEDSFFAETLGTNRTIRYLLTLQPTKPEEEYPQVREVRTIMDLGNGLNGHPNICHGGFVATMLDEIFGVLIIANIELKIKNAGPHHPNNQTNCYTAYLNTNYKKPTPAPSVVLCTARFEKKEGRKIYVSGTVGDGQGTVYSTGEGMFVETNAKI